MCREICDPKTVRFNCTCSNDYTGQRCEKLKYPRNCKDIWKNGFSISGKYRIFDAQNQPFLVYCDLESEPGFVWGLIQSFSLENRVQFKKSFTIDYPIDEDSLGVDWAAHRLSLSHMLHLAGSSTHLRATCNFHSEGFSYTDYARADLTNHNLFSSWWRLCKRYEYLNIRGIECYDCTAVTNNRDISCWLINSYKSFITFGCDFDGRPGIGETEYNFGNYASLNPEHRCSLAPSSTTEHWFGVKRD